MRALELPLIRFLLLGAVLFFVERALAPRAIRDAGAVIEISAPEVDALRRDWTLRSGREPNEAERAALIAEAADEEVLFREALRLGLDRSDPVVRRRLIANLRFAANEPAGGDEALLREADALGMRRNDVVVRRRLVQAIEQRIEASARRRPPADRDLADTMAVHADRFEARAAWRFAHVLVSAERHPGDLPAAAERLRASLAAEGAGPEAAALRSDPFLLGNRYGPASEAEIASAFGANLARRVAELEPGRWSEPVRSVYGLHLIWVEERIPGRQVTLAEAGERVRLEFLSDRERQALREGVSALRSRYRIEVEGVPVAARFHP